MAPDCESILVPVLMAHKVLFTEHLNISVLALLLLPTCTADLTTGTDVLEVLNVNGAGYLTMKTMKRKALRNIVHPPPYGGNIFAYPMFYHPLDRNRSGFWHHLKSSRRRS